MKRMIPVLFCVLSASALAAPRIDIAVTNPTSRDWSEAPVIVPIEPGWGELADASSSARWVAVASGVRAPVQCDDLDGDGKADELVFLAAVPAGGTVTYTLEPAGNTPPPPKRAHARFSLKGFDGPAWESDVIAYRIYWNLDNAIDVFGKTRPILSLDHWAKPGVPHNIEDEHGIDVLKIGRSIGLAGFGVWRDDQIHKVTNVMKSYTIRAAGPIRAVVELEYVNWHVGQRDPDVRPTGPVHRYDLMARMSICAGQFWGQADLQLKPLAGPMPEMVIGLPIHEDTELIQDEKRGIVGRWGLQALGDHDKPKSANLGIGFVVDPTVVIAYGQTSIDNYARVRLQDGRLSYRYHASWEKEPGGARSLQAYADKLTAVAELRPQVKAQVHR